MSTAVECAVEVIESHRGRLYGHISNGRVFNPRKWIVPAIVQMLDEADLLIPDGFVGITDRLREEKAALAAERNAARAAIERVRELHQRMDDGMCTSCIGFRYPCLTVEAIDDPA